MNEQNQSEQQSTNGWQNVGICKRFATDKIEFQYRMTFLELVDMSFGKRKAYTDRLSQIRFSELIGISEKTFRRHTLWLEEHGFIFRNASKMFTEKGSEAFSYSPVVPHGYGFVNYGQTNKKTIENIKDDKEEFEYGEI